MKREFEIKPYTIKERKRIESSKSINRFFILFFAILSIILIFLFIYGIYKSDDILLTIMFITFIIGIYLFFNYLIKDFISDIKQSNMFLERNEKYCSKGYLNGKSSEFRRLGPKSSITQFYATIDNKKYEISQKNYETINSGDYVYYEIKEPLYTEVKKIDELY